MTDVYADGATLKGIEETARNPLVKGFTTNPTLMKQAGLTDFRKFAFDALQMLKELKPEGNLSLEVFSDDVYEMRSQAREISNWGKMVGYPVYIKIPVTTTGGVSTVLVVSDLLRDNIPVNVTAMFTDDQFSHFMSVYDHLQEFGCMTPSIFSVFAGRIADTGVDPMPIMDTYALMIARERKPIKLLWASPREVLNYYQAGQCGVDIITMTPDLIKKLSLRGKSLYEYSVETVKMFRDDAVKSGFSI